jgi:hypothetical protein
MRMNQAVRYKLVAAIYLLIFNGVLGEKDVKPAASVLMNRRGGSTKSDDTTHEASNRNNDKLAIVFSDLDGTLIHYPNNLDDLDREPNNRIIELPASKTGVVGVISSLTFHKCQALRRRGIKLVLVSGARTSTLLQRLAYLPRADAYCAESGGRIFLPSNNTDETGYKVVPRRYDLAEEEDLEPFYVVEDIEWRRRMSEVNAAGWDGYQGNDLETRGQSTVPISERSGAIWQYARELVKLGLVIDTEGYASCFRVNKKQQVGQAEATFEKLIQGEINRPTDVSTSVNLGCVDFYPCISGKKLW